MRLSQLTIALGYEAPQSTVHFAFGYFFPTDLSSYRGDYSQLAINYTDNDAARALFAARMRNYDAGAWGDRPPPVVEEPKTVEWWIERLSKAEHNDERFEGYKGGGYYMQSHTKLYAAKDSGEYSEALIVRVSSDHNSRVYFETVHDNG
jgi:hypothetical protein